MRLLTPARSAMLSTRAPSYPLSVDSVTAATRIAALVSSGSRVAALRTCRILPGRRIFGPRAGVLGFGIILGLGIREAFTWAGYITTPLPRHRKSVRFADRLRSFARS